METKGKKFHGLLLGEMAREKARAADSQKAPNITPAFI